MNDHLSQEMQFTGREKLMNDFQQVLVEEYRRAEMLGQTEYPPATGKKINFYKFKLLSFIGKCCGKLGTRMKEHYAYLAKCEKCQMLLNEMKNKTQKSLT